MLLIGKCKGCISKEKVIGIKVLTERKQKKNSNSKE